MVKATDAIIADYPHIISNTENFKRGEVQGVLVACYKRDQKCVGIPKYDNEAGWNIIGGCAPNGVSAYRWVREINPTPTDKLGRWLIDTLRGRNLSGTMPHPQKQYRVICQNGMTKGEFLLYQTEQPTMGHYACNGKIFPTKEEAIMWAKDIIEIYGEMMDSPQQIDDFCFPQINPQETDNQYWDRAVKTILNAGTTKIIVGDQKFEVELW